MNTDVSIAIQNIKEKITKRINEKKKVIKELKIMFFLSIVLGLVSAAFFSSTFCNNEFISVKSLFGCILFSMFIINTLFFSFILKSFQKEMPKFTYNDGKFLYDFSLVEYIKNNYDIKKEDKYLFFKFAESQQKSFWF